MDGRLGLLEVGSRFECVFDETVVSPVAEGEADVRRCPADALVEDAIAMADPGRLLALIEVTPAEELRPLTRSLAVRALGELSARVEAASLRVVAAIAGPEPSDAVAAQEDFGAHEVAVAGRMSLPAADRKVALARALATRLPAAAESLRRGELSGAQAAVLQQATDDLPEPVARHVEARVLPAAAEQDVGAFRRAVHRAVAAVDPEWLIRSREARRRPEVFAQPGTDGTAWLNLHAPTEAIAVIHEGMSAYAAATKATLGGTVAARMVDGLRTWAETQIAGGGPGPDGGTPPKRHGQPYVVHVVVDLPTLLGLRSDPAHIPGHGPVPPEVAAWVLADGAPLRRLVTDPTTGHLLDYGRRTYVVPQPVADFLVARAIRSGGPHSGVSAVNSDFDHNKPFGQGGRTSIDNMTPLDRRWHRAKTFGGWRYELGADGSLLWTSPTGMTCRVPAEDYRLSDLDPPGD